VAGRRTELILQLVAAFFDRDRALQAARSDWLTRQSIGYALCCKAWLREETD
jgi:hypothetical protein